MAVIIPAWTAPQRFGDEPFFDWDFGDSEIRYTWKTLTAGFGTQNIWLGPSYLNSILHSNNAPAYPKFDIGLRRQRVTLPWLGWYIGDVEARLWAGQLRESKYFDSNSDNDQTMITGLALAYAPSFLKGLTLHFSRTYTTKWTKQSTKAILDLFLPFGKEGGVDDFDQRVTAGFNYFLPQANIDVYAEIGYNDTPAPGIESFLANFSHTIAFTAGLRKGLVISSDKNIYGELLFEYTHLEMSPYASQELWANNFYMHHIATQGYTNRGQWLGAGIGTGGNSQYLEFKLYYPQGSSSLFFSRNNTDNDFIIRHTTPSAGYPSTIPATEGWNHRTVLALGIKTNYFITSSINISGELAYTPILNSHYNYVTWHNIHLECGLKIQL